MPAVSCLPLQGSFFSPDFHVMTDALVPSLRRLAEVLRLNQTLLTAQWMNAALEDAGVEHSKGLTYAQLVDHLPHIFEEVCRVLEAQDLEPEEHAIARDARESAYWRTAQGYLIDELVRESDLFRQMLTQAVRNFADVIQGFTRIEEGRALHLIDEALSFVMQTSVRQAVHEHERKIQDYADMLQRANDELVRKQQLLSETIESRQQVTRRVVHDLRNFLNAFTTALEVLRRTPSANGRALALAERQASDMKTLIDELLEYSVVLSGHNTFAVEEFALRELYDEVVSVYRAAAEAKGLRLDSEFDAHLGATSSNRLKTKQIAVNLLSNALKYTQSGAIGLTMTALGADHWRLTVTDTGIGISPSDQARVFKEFERAAGSDTQGVGLGLAIVKELVRSLGGEIRLESRKGVGSVFEVRLPLQVSLMAAG